MPLTPDELAAADAARFELLVKESVEGLIPTPSDTVSGPDAEQTPGTSLQYARADHAHGPGAELPEASDGQTIRKVDGAWQAHDWPTTPPPPPLPELDGDVVGPTDETEIVKLQGTPIDVELATEGQTLRLVNGVWVAHDWPSASEPPPPPPPPPPGDPLPGDIVNAAGEVVPSAYMAKAYAMMKTEGLLYRFGQPAPALPAGFPTLPERPDAGFINHGGGNNVYFSHGPENNTDPNLYMTVNGTAIGKPNVGESLSSAIRWLQVVAVDRETFQQRPQQLWQDNVALPPDVSNYESRNEVEYNDPAYLPVCQFRAYGADAPATRMSVVCTQGDKVRGIPAMMFTTGTYTAHNECHCFFEVGMVPTAVAVTGGGEWAFVSVWDTNTTTGKVAVIALGSSPQGVPWDAVGPANRYDWWHGWTDTIKPGFFDQGNWSFAKVVHYIDLPAVCKAPTSIVCATGMDPMKHIDYDGNGWISSFAYLNSPMADNLAKMQPGGEDYEKFAKGGLAVVGSKSEGSIVCIDFTPLVEYVNEMYLGSAASNLLTQAVGHAPDQWPYAFEHLPASAHPVVVKTFAFDEQIQDLGMSTDWGYWSKDDQKRIVPEAHPWFEPDPHYARFWSVTPNGRMRIFSTGRYLPGVKPTTGRTPDDIAQVGEVEGLGDNITCLFGLETHPNVPHATNGGAGFVDRQNRHVGYVKFTTPADGLDTTGVAGTIVQDSRLQDPIHATISDPYHTIANVVCVADHAASKLRNYRYGPATYGGDTPWSPAPTLDPDGEYCGALDCDFKPVQVFASNTP